MIKNFNEYRVHGLKSSSQAPLPKPSPLGTEHATFAALRLSLDKAAIRRPGALTRHQMRSTPTKVTIVIYMEKTIFSLFDELVELENSCHMQDQMVSPPPLFTPCRE
jgi:hypothetical protein